MSPHYATQEGTLRYAQRFASRFAPNHYRMSQGLAASSIGLGTYLGGHDEETDLAYTEAVLTALREGINVLDTAINYRFQRSERNIGAALTQAFEEGLVRREEVIVATKGGYIPFDSEPPADPGQWFLNTFVMPGVATTEDLVEGCHCMTPAYLEHQLETSLKNLRLDSVDIYYLHNPEQQLDAVDQEEFYTRIKAAFELLEAKAKDGKIQFYGTATWNGYRVPANAPSYLDLGRLAAIAKEAGGPKHRFRWIQLPHNLAMPEALIRANQQVEGSTVSPLGGAMKLGISAMASASMFQGQLAGDLPGKVGQIIQGLETNAQRSIQFVRSTPGISTALVGMSQAIHVTGNLEAARKPSMTQDDFMKLFAR